jgi:hypothetical protein
MILPKGQLYNFIDYLEKILYFDFCPTAAGIYEYKIAFGRRGHG